MTVFEQAPAPPTAARRRVTRSRGMSLWEAVLVALQGLVANKLRSFLTVRAIIMGVGSVILTIGLGQRAAAASQAITANMGTNVLGIRPDQQRTGAVQGGLGSAQTLTEEDAEAILKECPSVKAVAPEYTG